MRIHEIMTLSPRTCTPEETLMSIAQAMAEGDFGAVAVVDADNHPLGICTDRDIAVRAVALGMGPQTTVGEIMTEGCTCCSSADDARDVIRLMEDHQIRRVVAVDDQQCVCGIVATADIAEKCQRDEAGEVLQEVSKHEHHS